MRDTIGYFNQNFRAEKLGDVRWSHAVNSREKLDRTLNDGAVMIIESDIRINRAGKAVCAHPPETESDLYFSELVDRARGSKKGLKLDFKDPEILERCLKELANAGLSQPLLLNADILDGNGAPRSKFSPIGFISLCEMYCPEAVLSVGWTTTNDPQLGYTKENAAQMLELIGDRPNVTFPVRACLLPTSFENLLPLLGVEGRTISVWNNEPVTQSQKEWLRAFTDPSKTFYDFIDDNKESISIW